MADHADRRRRLRQHLASMDVEAALITNLINVRYLSGFSGSNAALLVGVDGTDRLSTDGRYTEQAASESSDLEVLSARHCAVDLLAYAGSHGVRRTAFEAHDVTVEQWETLTATAADATQLVPLGRVVEELREIKDDYELALLREACAIGDRALAKLQPLLAVGQTERKIARLLEDLMLDHGGDGAAFETIVASGPHSSIPHHSPTDRPLERGDFLKIDFGSRYRGYHADMTRTFVVGTPPEGWQRETYELVAAAQAAGLAAVVAGVEVAAVDRVARSIVEAAGLGEAFPHGLGHGVGLEIHEAPLLASSSTGILSVGVALTIEPGVYLPGRGGVRIEDTVVVTDGAPELLTTTTRELLVVAR